ncbi:UPF0382 membrane protein SAB0533 [Pseudoalteromonas sp. BSi20311]|jgi:uncharacterized membrane protein YgdD (TMEM256/DUF423 family)|uniref:DUF423 domain-containing protein n=1 Tax=unclassified Pseudoalteromonas TaxID=194690 RepID=UPI0002318373|nr:MULTISPECIES: DUF423 domain-containing protein [unclassified Pseudoalteromonas]QBJ63243.1 hypothetical protein B1F84_09480 [Pseudoalteromonas sp. DL-6]GAA65637.1 UPF0382 membrane protein SAB0533 [Pseudoalteromonas sp. BSi20311]GAA72866.1 UPF0382 membrane protein SAB0533 [Pseudoalteromonas sp. BSi20439]HCP97918.1 DUF423 domain-containing protein [Pseudoalteromonas sp.]|tara:strand:- start:1787 stop:2155 length:369 start_codon:yes stop_codon:yes gene_type:complete
MIKLFLLAGSFFCLFSVILGAFAAHGLKSRLSDYAIGIFKTAAEYQMVHGLALIAVAILIKWGINLSLAGGFFIAGTLLFSGSLYLLALTGLKWLGPITPLGGLCFIIGWIVILVQVARFKF